MATNLRLVIGSHIIDSVEGVSSASTIAGAVLAFDPENGILAETTETADVIPFKIRLVNDGADTGDVVDQVLDVLAALDEMAVEGMIIEWSSGETLIEIDPASAVSISYTTKKEFGDDGAELVVSVSAERIDGNAIGVGEWQIQRNSAARMFIVANLNYENLSTALAEAENFKDGSVRPTWMPSSCRAISETNVSSNRKVAGGIAALTAANMRPVTMEIVWEQMASHMAASSAFDDVKKAEWRVEGTARDPLSDRAGNSAGLDVSLGLTLEFKTEQNTGYSTGDPSPTSGSVMFAKAVACAEVALAEAESRLSESIQLTRAIERSIVGEDGVYEVTLIGVTGNANRVLEWNETEIYEETYRGQITADTGGGEWEWEHAAGDEKTIQHSLTIKSLGGARGYVRPVNLKGSNWRRIYRGDEPSRRSKPGGSGKSEYRSTFNRTYRYINPKSGRKGGSDRDTLSTPSSERADKHAGQFG